MPSHPTCPQCIKPLVTRSSGSIQTDNCPTCFGVWFGKDELRTAKDEADPELQWMDFDLWKEADALSVRPSQVDCPACSQRMIEMEYGSTGVTVDHCGPCQGFWLEGGEFEAIVVALQNEANSKPLSEYLKASLQEAVELATGRESLSSEWKDFATVLRLMGRRLMIENPNVTRGVVAIQRSL